MKLEYGNRMKFRYNEKTYLIVSETKHSNGFSSTLYHTFEDDSYVSGTTSKTKEESFRLLCEKKNIDTNKMEIL